MGKRARTLISDMGKSFFRQVSSSFARVAGGAGASLPLLGAPIPQCHDPAQSTDRDSWEYTNPFMTYRDRDFFERLQQLVGYDVPLGTIRPSSTARSNNMAQGRPPGYSYDKDMDAQQAAALNINPAFGGLGYGQNQANQLTVPTFSSVRMALDAEINHARDIVQKLDEICENLLGTTAVDKANVQEQSKPVSSSVLGLLDFDIKTLSHLNNTTIRILRMINSSLGPTGERT